MARYEVCANPERRHDFVLLFDVTDGNPNGDPDAGNMPRVDPETMQGLVTDVCLKRKVRDYVAQVAGGAAPNRIYVQNQGIALNTLHQEAYTARDIKSTGTKQKRGEIDQARSWMCSQFYDVRMFGAVMTTGVNAGQVRGPLQLTFSRSIDPVAALDVSITRVAITKAEDVEHVAAEDPKDEKGGKVTEMGQKAIVPYGLYVGHGFYSPSFAKTTGATRHDLELFWDALQGMWDLDRSASRGLMSCRGLYVFSHENPVGNAPAHQLFESIVVGPAKDGRRPPRQFKDYSVTVSPEWPSGITLTKLVW